MFTSKVTSSSVSSDGETVKLLVQLQDGLSVEAVIMTYSGNGSDDCASKSRATVCVSSEVGCQMGCTFCATGTMGLIAELTSGEIVEQLVHARSVKPVRNVVFMGMGEPLNNYNAVAAAIRLMIHPQVFALKQRSITVSTVGVTHRLASLARDLPGVSLALSLHAPNQQLRRLIVPSAQAFKLDKLMAAVDAYTSATGNRVFVEYTLPPPPSPRPLSPLIVTRRAGTCCLAPTSTALTAMRTSLANCCAVATSASISSPGTLCSAPASTSGRRLRVLQACSRAL